MNTFFFTLLTFYQIRNLSSQVVLKYSWEVFVCLHNVKLCSIDPIWLELLKIVVPNICFSGFDNFSSSMLYPILNWFRLDLCWYYLIRISRVYHLNFSRCLSRICLRYFFLTAVMSLWRARSSFNLFLFFLLILILVSLFKNYRGSSPIKIYLCEFKIFFCFFKTFKLIFKRFIDLCKVFVLFEPRVLILSDLVLNSLILQRLKNLCLLKLVNKLFYPFLHGLLI